MTVRHGLLCSVLLIPFLISSPTLGRQTELNNYGNIVAQCQWRFDCIIFATYKSCTKICMTSPSSRLVVHKHPAPQYHKSMNTYRLRPHKVRLPSKNLQKQWKTWLDTLFIKFRKNTQDQLLRVCVKRRYIVGPQDLEMCITAHHGLFPQVAFRDARGYLPFTRENRNYDSSWKIKWFTLFRQGSFRKFGL